MYKRSSVPRCQYLLNFCRAADFATSPKNCSQNWNSICMPLVPSLGSAQEQAELKSSLLKAIFPLDEKTFLKSRRNEDLPQPFSPIKADESEKSAFSSFMPLKPLTKSFLKHLACSAAEGLIQFHCRGKVLVLLVQVIYFLAAPFLSYFEVVFQLNAAAFIPFQVNFLHFPGFFKI